MGIEFQEAQTVVYLGNRQAIEVIEIPDSGISLRRPLRGKLCTKIVFPSGMKLMDAARDVTHPQGVWNAHSNAEAPAWVASTDPTLAHLLASHWGCEVRDPDPEHEASGGADDHPSGGE